MSGETEYDARYLAGIAHFNAGDYYAAHEVWEELWRALPGPERHWPHGLIQAAVAIYHAGRGNAAGAARLFRSGRERMERLPSPTWGLDAGPFWADVARHLAPALDPDPPAGVPLLVAPPPVITLNPVESL